MSGEILDWSRSALKLKLATGQIREIDVRHVLKVQTPKDPLIQQGLLRMEQGDDRQAAELFRQAFLQKSNSGQRDWRLVELLAFRVRCYVNLSDFDSALQCYGLLYQSSSDSAFMNCIPLVWTSCTTSPQLQKTAQNWLSSSPLSFLSLSGASILLAGPRRNEVVESLKRLSRDNDSDIAQLARFQLLRVQLTELPVDELNRLSLEYQKIPIEYQSGPAFQLGRLWNLSSDAQKSDRAALYYLKCAWNPHTDKPLAARALYSAGKILQDSGHQEEAVSVYHELLQKYPKSEWATIVMQENKKTNE